MITCLSSNPESLSRYTGSGEKSYLIIFQKEKRGTTLYSLLCRSSFFLIEYQQGIFMKTKLPKIEELLDAGVHFGHQTKRWHPKMEPYIYGVKKNIHIIDLERTEDLLKDACAFLYETAKRGEQIIFVGTKKQAREVVELEAKRCGAMYVTERWIGGTVTNFRIIKKNIDKLLSLMKRREEGDLEKYTKKERLLIDREIEKLQRNIGGIVNFKGTMGALFVVDSRREKTSIREAKIAGVKVVGLIDTNSDPASVDYVIPGNDDAIKSVAIILKAVSDAVEEGYLEYSKQSEKKEEPVVVVKEPEETKVQVSVAEAPRVIESFAEPEKGVEKTVQEVVLEPVAEVKVAVAKPEKVKTDAVKKPATAKKTAKKVTKGGK